MSETVRFKQKRWDLSDVLPTSSGPEFDATLKELYSDVDQFELLREKLNSFSKDDMVKALQLYERIERLTSRPVCYASLRLSEDTQAQESRVLENKMGELKSDVTNKMLFFRLWWMSLDESRAQELMPENGDWKRFLTQLRKDKPYMLDENVEQAIAIKDGTGMSAWTNFYSQLTNKFTYVVRVDGQTLKDEGGSRTRRFTRGDLISLIMGVDPKEREAAYRSLLRTYAEHGDELGEIYRTIVRDWRNEHINLRHHKSPIAVMNVVNDIPDEAIDALLSVCRENTSVFQDFFRKKAGLLGMSKMSRYHIYAPLQPKDRTIPYSDAVEFVLDAFDSFDRGFGKLARRVFEQDHVDAEIRQGKEFGAFCSNVAPDIVPYLQLNYAGKTLDVVTIGHESGHAVHTQMASRHSPLTYLPSIPMAETASVFGEMLLFDRMVEQERDPQVKRDLLVAELGNLYGTIQRQAYFTLFEIDAHDSIGKHATVDKLCELWSSNLKEQFGSAVTVPREFEWEWTTIPHIYGAPFYCYSYPFGTLLTLALYDQYRNEGRSFVPKYLEILSAGGSESPARTLGRVGIDIKDPRFWQNGFNVIRDMVHKL
ncbi:MAG: M3 family oligoendopeptidase [Candidatus Aenigmarchaeota archaeon]|nr:M3 family oligoendopeptidase [Candidatus Aenigmarchaeota archaeon]